MFLAALSVIVKRWKQPTCPSRKEWINKPWHVQGIVLSSKEEGVIDTGYNMSESQNNYAE